MKQRFLFCRNDKVHENAIRNRMTSRGVLADTLKSCYERQILNLNDHEKVYGIPLNENIKKTLGRHKNENTHYTIR